MPGESPKRRGQATTRRRRITDCMGVERLQSARMMKEAAAAGCAAARSRVVRPARLPLVYMPLGNHETTRKNKFPKIQVIEKSF